MRNATEKMDANAETAHPLSGRKILFVGVGYFSYDDIIAESLRAMGAKVVSIAERPYLLLQSHPLSSPINKVSWLRTYAQRRHEGRLKAQLVGQEFDTVLVIKGDSLDIGFFDHLRRVHPHTRFILYQWDSIKLVKNFAELRKRFDRCLTFDRVDAASDQTLLFRPLFFSRQAVVPEASPDGMVFVGSLHSDRLRIVKRIRSEAAARGVRIRTYIRVGIFSFLRQLLKGDVRDIYLRALPYETYITWIRQAEAVLDIPHPLQTGLTMRTLEAIGLGRKVVTTNPDIVHYPFYSSDNVCIVSEDHPRVPAEFLNGTSAAYDPNIVRLFSLRRWILDVLGLCSPSDSHSEREIFP